MRGEKYQFALIFLGLLIAIFFSVFFFRELFPEYKIYQDAYIALEKFRSSYTGEPPPVFQKGIKQILITREDKGPSRIDRCISCHVALEFSHFSPTSEDYVWKKLEEKVTALKAEGKTSEAETLASLKTAQVGEHVYDMTKVLRAHPLIGKETRPFEYHPIDDWGCISCHGGNGLSVVTDRAHGPIFDGQYEIENVGPHPSFLEKDLENDPPFSKVFNHKPGHELLFQTNPLYVGGLIEAKCAECHKPTTSPVKERFLAEREKSGGINISLPHFQKGEDLYITQACYACHRIAGFARGGVGPELTNEGKAYPWFLKESIVWPQADLRTSTMPNYRLDHPEVEDLMTFLLAQHGRKQSQSEVDYKVAIQQWDGGAKRPWEEPLNPGLLQDVRQAMKIFATEGCAACHRLQGFDAKTGYAIEKEQGEKIDFKNVYQEKLWFKNLFPETISGSEIVRVVEKHHEEIDKHIISDARTKGLLEDLEQEHPGLIESFYSPFGYALRAKDDQPNESKSWKERIRRILMVYVQEYGLGRLVGPRPNWSGIYRSDEWLMEHFRQPAHETAKSIMPVMPFDDTKFYALTHMLDVLGKQNRNQVHQVWKTYGFNPAEAYQIHCSQCHGEFLLGNGPVSEWIYPIPKNLQNANFLRNYTKENVALAITHGVKGTAMPPLGEVATDKPNDGIPVLSQEEIAQLVDWLFSPLPGENITDKDVLKWQYKAEDVNREMEELNKIGKNNAKESVEIFDKRPDPYRPGENAFYIKKVYDTKQNRLAGEAFFEQNCAACHGAEGDGQGIRAGAMIDAKPRMLTNLHWIQSRDDLRLLRSIKYGVPGTSMTPWGDLTNPLQRLQLVLFIRSLTEEQDQRNLIGEALYQLFDIRNLAIDKARISENKQLNALEKEAQELSRKRSEIESAEEKTSLYKQELSVEEKKTSYAQTDQLLQKIQQSVKKQKKIYQIFGESLIGNPRLQAFFADYLSLLKLKMGEWKTEKGRLVVSFEKEPKSPIVEKMIKNIKEEQNNLQKERYAELSKLPSPEREKALKMIQNEIEALKKTEEGLLFLNTEAERLDIEQKSLYETYGESIKANRPLA